MPVRILQDGSPDHLLPGVVPDCIKFCDRETGNIVFEYGYRFTGNSVSYCLILRRVNSILQGLHLYKTILKKILLRFKGQKLSDRMINPILTDTPALYRFYHSIYRRQFVRAEQQDISPCMKSHDCRLSRRVVVGNAAHLQPICDNKAVKLKRIDQNSLQNGRIEGSGQSRGPADGGKGDVCTHHTSQALVDGPFKGEQLYGFQTFIGVGQGRHGEVGIRVSIAVAREMFASSQNPFTFHSLHKFYSIFRTISGSAE